MTTATRTSAARKTTTNGFTTVPVATRLCAAAGSVAITLVLFAAVMTMADVPAAEEMATVVAGQSTTA